jgi:hypothetical protein
LIVDYSTEGPWQNRKSIIESALLMVKYHQFDSKNATMTGAACQHPIFVATIQQKIQ